MSVKLKPMCLSGVIQLAVNNRGYLLPCCYLDSKNTLNDPEIKKLTSVSKISEVEDIEQIVLSKEWIEFEKILRERNFKKIPPTCVHHCKVRDDIDKIKKETYFNTTGKIIDENIV